jgi:hypothetical protein
MSFMCSCSSCSLFLSQDPAPSPIPLPSIWVTTVLVTCLYILATSSPHQDWPWSWRQHGPHKCWYWPTVLHSHNTQDIVWTKMSVDDFCLLAYNVMQSIESQPAFRKNMSQAGSSASCWFLAWLIHQPWRLRRHIPVRCWLSSVDYTALHPRRQNPS